MVNASIAVEQGESIESIIRRFKKSVDKANVIRTLCTQRPLYSKCCAPYREESAGQEKSKGWWASMTGLNLARRPRWS